MSMDGPNKIRKELEDNDIGNTYIDESLNSFTVELEIERIEKIVDKQIKLNNNKGANLLKKKIQIYLLNLGYTYELINMVLSNKKLVDDNLYKKEYEKLFNQLSKKYSGKELEYKLKQKLYQKGFNTSDYE
jgi:SOS response regulatory protein OraA/RecX